jgi:EAL domain-containing protein (putative c-di-GMP-specific phosphodiesterase class I)
MEVLAEGVETEMQKDILIKGECDLMQGNLFCCPVYADKIPEIVGMGKC